MRGRSGRSRDFRSLRESSGRQTPASVAVAGGAKIARLQNEKGVVLEVHGAQVGLELSLNLGGATITMP
jgi:hypothetical protein